MKKKIQTVRLHAAMITLALLVPVLIAAPAVIATEGATQPPLLVFRPGSADEPTWHMLKLEVPETGISLIIDQDILAARCPSIWAFGVLVGTPQDADVYSAITILSGSGKDGVEAQNAIVRPVRLEATVADGETYCYKSDLVIDLALPQGTAYFVTYTAGEPFEAVATITPSAPGIRVLDASSGATSFYIDSEAFHTDGVYAGAHTPQANARPVTYLSGGVAGAELNYLRYTEHAFEHHPMYVFGTRTTSVGNALIEDPLGEIRRLALNGNSYTSWVENTSAFPPGQYTFRVDWAVSGGVGPPWYVAGADIWFPEENRE